VYFFPVIVPITVWKFFNIQAARFIDSGTNAQSYGGMKWEILSDAFGDAESSSISYLQLFRDTYINALFSKDILIHGSYVVMLIMVILIIFSITLKNKNSMLVFFDICILVGGIAYALLMYILYLVSFSQKEACNLASYERYMNTYIVAIFYFAVSIIFENRIHIKYYSKTLLLFVICVFYISVVHIDAFAQMVPDILASDKRKVQYYQDIGDTIIDNTEDDSKVYIVSKGDNGGKTVRFRYFCNPRYVAGGSIGPDKSVDGDYSRDLSTDDFREELADYDYLYFEKIDYDFLKKYKSILGDDCYLSDHVLYKIGSNNNKLKLNYAFYEQDELSEITILNAYLNIINDEDYLVFCCVKDDASTGLTNECSNQLYELGIKTDLKNRYRDSFIAVIDGGKLIYEKCSDKKIIYSNEYGSDISYKLESAGYDDGNNAQIVINNVDYSKNGRGMNFVVYDKEERKVIDSVAFDTYMSGYCIR
jgi:hypothetical protein